MQILAQDMGAQIDFALQHNTWVYTLNLIELMRNEGTYGVKKLVKTKDLGVESMSDRLAQK